MEDFKFAYICHTLYRHQVFKYTCVSICNRRRSRNYTVFEAPELINQPVVVCDYTGCNKYENSYKQCSPGAHGASL